MPADPNVVEQRIKAALSAIKDDFGKSGSEYGTTLFVSHHLEEVEASYWVRHLQSPTPEPSRVLDILIFKSHWGGDEGIDTFDFSLPDEATNYVISVGFNDNGDGDVAGITMES